MWCPPQHSLHPKWALWALGRRPFPVDVCLSQSVPRRILSIFFSLLSSSPSIPFYPITSPSASQPDPCDFLPSGSCAYLSSPLFPACLNSKVAISPPPWCPPGLPPSSAGSPPSELQQCVFSIPLVMQTPPPSPPHTHLDPICSATGKTEAMAFMLWVVPIMPCTKRLLS